MIFHHPEYDAHILLWKRIKDFYAGETTVKSKGSLYLPLTPGQVEDNKNNPKSGDVAYANYLARAVFPDYIREAVEVAIGLLHQKEAVITLPPEMEGLREKCSIKGESIIELLIRINEQQLVPGRCGLLIDLPETASGNAMPFIALYDADAIKNWDESNDYVDTDLLDFVILDETCLVREGFTWVNKIKYRILKLNKEFFTPVYQQSVVESMDVSPEPSDYKTISLLGKSLEEIPFIFINSKDLLPDPDTPTLLGLADICLSIYRGEADYRFTLFMQSQDTLIIEGQVINPNPSADPDAPIRVGAGSSINLQMGGKAYYIGTSAKGLSEQRTCLENDRRRAENATGKVTGQGKQANVESGAALSLRLGAKAATLNQIALTSALALEKALKIIAKWKGYDETLVSVKPNLDFAKVGLQGQELVNTMSARQLGAPISLESIHMWLKDKGLTNLSFEEEIAKILEENKLGITPDPNMDKNIQPNNNQSGAN